MDKQKKIVISHPTGNANTRGAVNGFYQGEALESFHTCIACFKGGLLYLLSSFPFLKDIRRRSLDRRLKKYVKTYPLKEIIRLIIRKWRGSDIGWQIDAVYHQLDKNVACYIHTHYRNIAAVYAYDEGAYYSFQQAHKEKIKCLFDLPIIHWRTYQRLLKNEEVNNPHWSSILGVFNDSEAKLLRKDKELLMADCIFVASSFTKQSILDDFPYPLKTPIKVIPYGFPAVTLEKVYVPVENRKIRLLYVGRLSQAKGLSYLFEALDGLYDRFSLTVVGNGDIDGCPPLKEALLNTNHISYLEHNKVLDSMREHDILVFPSLFEGFGLVVTEAMSQGTPVITTERTCGRDLIQSGENGWLVEAGSVLAIRNCLLNILKHPEDIGRVGKNAMETAQQRPWSRYGEELVASINTFLLFDR